nr:cytochrome b6-f complex subunit VII [Haramonas pauciplastida]UTE94930.1 cytochrome b6-f complex subunit VII [Haramonas pauciplastida]
MSEMLLISGTCIAMTLVGITLGFILIKITEE